tara:strand:- start:2800 stop:3153 length:354 start_codon:yes stop_codon:yes gene_type:complete
MVEVNSNYPPLINRTTPPDPFDRHREELDSPASAAFSITPSQSDLPVTIRGLYIGTSGNVFCKMAGGNATHSAANVFFRNLVAGTILPVRMDGVYVYNSTEADTSQSTTATYLVGLY